MAEQQKIIIVTPQQSSRLQYVLDWIFCEQLSVDFEIVVDTGQVEADSHNLLIGYGVAAAYAIPNSGLLFQKDIAPQTIKFDKWQKIPTLFADDIVGYDLPFDLFAAVFYLLTRYEEYLPFTPDKHGRFPAEESVLSQQNLLNRPIVDEWLHLFSKVLIDLGLVMPSKSFSFQATFDIDIAWSFNNKGWRRNIGGVFRDLLDGNWRQVTHRARALIGRQIDPFDSFALIDKCHSDDKLRPIFFILAASQNSNFDKHILPSHPAMQNLIKILSEKYTIGIHPSYYSNLQINLLPQELASLEAISQQKIQISRQHYIRLQLPQTYRQLLEQGIQEDYSMGYSTQLGFRAGTAHPFLWYDLQKEKVENLKVFPFCFMDTTAHYELKLDVNTAFEKLNKMKQILQSCNAPLVIIFHNFSLGTDAEWKGWPKAYSNFVAQINNKIQ